MARKDEAPVLIVPAAGRGKRMGGEKNKLYMLLKGKPVLAHTVANALKTGLFGRVIVVVAPGEEEDFRRWVTTPFFYGDKRIVTVRGGKERQQSVFNGLQWLSQQGVEADTVVCVHDGARPLIDSSLAREGYREALEHGAAVPGLPLKDTVKAVDEENNVVDTPPRDRLVAIQTPQCFRFSLLWEAHCKAEKSGFKGSDDAFLVEKLGCPVRVFPGSENNIKLTTPIDFQVAEILLSALDSGENEHRDDFEGFYDIHCR